MSVTYRFNLMNWQTIELRNKNRKSMKTADKLANLSPQNGHRQYIYPAQKETVA